MQQSSIGKAHQFIERRMGEPCTGLQPLVHGEELKAVRDPCNFLIDTRRHGLDLREGVGGRVGGVCIESGSGLGASNTMYCLPLLSV